MDSPNSRRSPEFSESELRHLLEAAGFEAERSTQLLSEFLDLLYERNEQMNLTAVPRARAWSELVVDSLLPLLTLEAKESQSLESVIDVGTGAGFPGIPLAVLVPHASFTLLDSHAKRCSFLSDVVDTLSLSNVTICCERAEIAGKNAEMRERFSHACAKAVASLPQLLELCAPFVSTGGRVWAYKAVAAEEELARSGNAISALSLEPLEALSLTRKKGEELGLPAEYLEKQRSVVRFGKRSELDPRFPRSAQAIQKRPL